ncbi:MAG: glycosyltransferase [Candidatus Dormibacteria bacterium]
MNLAIICDRREGPGGVSDHAPLLLAELERRGHRVFLAASEPSVAHWAAAGHLAVPVCAGWDRAGVEHAARALAGAEIEGVVIEFTPHQYQPRGLPWTFSGLASRLTRRGIRVATLMHELYIPWWLPPRRTVAGAVQRLAVMRLAAGSRRFGVSFVGRHRAFLHLAGRGRWVVVPTAPNLPPPDASARARLVARLAAGAAEADTLLVLWGSPHPGLQLAPAVAALTELQARGWPWRLAVIGTVGDRVMAALEGHPELRARVSVMGFMAAQALSDLLAAADLTLFPFEDGLCSRRGTVAAALQAGAAMVSTDGVNTDPWLRDARAARLAPAGDAAAFAHATLGLAEDAHARERLREHARALFQRSFEWRHTGDLVEGMLL